MKFKNLWRSVGTSLLLGVTLPAWAQGFIVQHNFTDTPDGNTPGQLVWANGLFYGATASGGTDGDGMIYRFSPNGAGFAKIYDFTGSTNNGNSPNTLLATSTTIYGTTANGGTNGVGMIFALGTNGTGFASLHSFGAAPDGYYPEAGLILIGATLYGTASAGGTNNYGIIFSLNTNGTGYTILHFFTNNPDGYSPQSELVASGSTLYGTTRLGGAKGYGTIFSISTNGTGYTVLRSFTNNPDGQYPYGGLVLNSGVLYGVTIGGGTNNTGTIFSINSNGSGFKLLYSFTAIAANVDGWQPEATLTLSGGTLYGTTHTGGTGGQGTVFQVSTNGSGFAVLKSFTTSPADGADPLHGVILLGSTLWGTTPSGGTGTYGTLYSLPLSPAIIQQPQDLTVADGNPASFTNVVSGAPPLFYQWYFNTSTPVSGGTSAVLSIASATTNQAGFYSVVITNSYGSITSSVAKLTVNVAATVPSITQQPLNLTVTNGNPASFTSAASGTAPLFYQWYFNANTPIGGATSPILNIPSATTNQAGFYSVVVTNLAGSATSSPAQLAVVVPATGPLISQQPQNYTVTNGYTASFNTIASGNAPLYYQWYFNTNTPVAAGTNNVLVITSATTNQAGYYSVIVSNADGSTVSSPAKLSVVSTKPIIFSPPQDTVAGYAFTASFSVTAAGQSPLKYQWYSNTVASQVYNAAHRLAGKTNATLSLTATFTNVSYYSVVVTNTLGAATSSPAMLTVFRAPLIISNPQPVSVALGDPASFFVGVIGANLLKYQWYFNTNAVLTNLLGNALGGQTNATLAFNAVGSSLLGNYSVIITNTYGRATSSPVALAILIAAGQPMFLSYSFVPSGSGFSLTLSNTASSANRLWASTNLASPSFWGVIASNVMAANGLWLFTDTNVVKTNQARFYRASSP